jgi:hypothetical protein
LSNWKVQLNELPEQIQSRVVVCAGGKFFVRKASEMFFLVEVLDLGAPASVLFVPVNASKSTLEVSGAGHPGRVILGVGGPSKVLSDVVQSVSVPVVHLNSPGCPHDFTVEIDSL